MLSRRSKIIMLCILLVLFSLLFSFRHEITAAAKYTVSYAAKALGAESQNLKLLHGIAQNQPSTVTATFSNKHLYWIYKNRFTYEKDMHSLLRLFRNHIQEGLDMYYKDTGSLPTREQNLSALCTDPGIEGWNGPYVPSCNDLVGMLRFKYEPVERNTFILE